MGKVLKKIFFGKNKRRKKRPGLEPSQFRTRLRILAFCGLMLYWLAIFVLTHIPTVPSWVVISGMSDKTMHLIAYFVLTFLFWTALSAGTKARWNSWRVWVTIAFIAVYAVCDELIQKLVHRQPDIMDFSADMLGCIMSLIIWTFAGFWLAGFLHGVVVIVILNCFSVYDLAGTSEAIGVLFYFLGYGFIAYSLSQALIPLSVSKGINRFYWAFPVPVLLLLLMKAWDLHTGLAVEIRFVAIALLGIVYSLAVSWFMTGRKSGQNSRDVLTTSFN
ncbi:putative integral membrane protein [Limihaloglobus sulfuriphilus]|uniref:Putative integral membrane protein n=1 Tax=Limihaloglobus sulfuriphilus TaxID=1851148 RepID=A0A1Q2MAF8_9BACT|nr:VanZ family protein [Limihaloglobus sulfuriphilus]AQQ69703.1 putative integral membrane protein [Limihaloglobus sulfuriphilus]